MTLTSLVAVQSNIHPGPNLPGQVTPVSFPGIGTAVATQDAYHVYSSATLVGSGYVNSSAYSVASITAKEVGWLDVTFNYRIQETGTVPLGESLHAVSRVGIFGSDREVRQVETIVPTGQSLDVMRTISGTFTERYFFDAIGSVRFLELGASSRSVPVPGMLWPTVAGLMGLAWYAARRRKHTA